jgi:hypothetical protein
MPHMLAQEHMGMVDALRYGTARNVATISAALAAIGSQESILVPTFLDDGVWTVASNLTIPTNVHLLIPPGATVSINAGITLTLNGGFTTWGSWNTGAGSVIYNGTSATAVLMDVVQSRQVYLPTDALVLVSGVAYAGSGIATGRQVSMFTQNGANSVGIRFAVPPSSGVGPQGNGNVWDMGEDAFNNFYITRPGSNPRVVLNDTGMGLSNTGTVTPTHLLHLLTDDAFKPATNTWSTTSDLRLKNVVGDYTDGLAFLQTLPQAIRYTFNGKAHTPANGVEYVTFPAQDLQAVAPDWVSTYQDKLDDSDSAPTDVLAINTSTLIYTLVNAVKELAARVSTLEGLPRTRTTDEAPEAEAPPRRRRH